MRSFCLTCISLPQNNPMEREQNISNDNELNYTLKRKGESLEKETTKYQKVSDLGDPGKIDCKIGIKIAIDKTRINRCF
jgi:hypothetical protein